MNKLLIILFFLFSLALNSTAQKPAYDSILAKKLNADEYGMKSYVFVILKTGSNVSKDKEAKDKAFAGHMTNIKKMAANGKLAVAGPFENGGNNRGIFVLNVTTIDEVKKLLEGDNAITEKYLEPEYIMWYGSAALQEIPSIHEKIQKSSF